MATLTPSALNSTKKKKVSFAEGQRIAKRKAYEKQAPRKKIKLQELTVFTQQLAAMLEAGLPLVTALEALEDQTENPVFQVIIRNVRTEVSAGKSFSESCAAYPKAFPNLFISMVEAGEASGGLAEILDKTSAYFEETVKLVKQIKGAMTYPIAVIALAVGLVNVLLIFVIPVFAEMFSDFGAELPKPTQILIDLSAFLRSYIIFLIAGIAGFIWGLKRFVATPKGRRIKDQTLLKLPVVGELVRKVSLSRFCRTYAILMRAGVPILRTLEIVSRASDNTYIEAACKEISKHISQGGQVSEVLAIDPYFPPTVKHMTRAGEQTGNVDGMLVKVADFYDNEIDTLVAALTSLMEPLLICFLGVVIGGIVMAMFLPIFQLSSVVA
ncbi:MULTISPECIES: type II secretion system F family protein [unclassified Lentimonas]|uniref:type II secretion system F family protein n=1 Tax=unclassified Lentimonas TaxID=2630993 RepID=UPI001325E815|nr:MULTISPECIES: type II secretion system F family protein [unclassified Lentimonas]CAA6679479.1 Type IV fimbrial assembly protein PilC [Lentimonas sp. CC4]CAA6687150.1 Type IV fimbrial assembly protein PilC [Lentimonas sp. CC6]CAA7075503.1 Type IV fimbrial assembly protein PilC [Lentimonas sp. CC4]CAA7170270.1 Type IV fimbrial assembly protein PilC [Lentimonas sp. CC21]CAA7182564.1 Type IV fimbrial assembly protein PilC [Lentimonas sp. CC8]